MQATIRFRAVADGFESYARAVFDRAGLEVSDDDIALVALIHAGYEASARVLDQADLVRFPHEPIDPRRAPEP